jgi:competence protein ComEC
MMRKYLIYLLVVVTAVVWIAVITYPSNNFRIITCDVGQGDAILAIYGKTQILVDGGPDKKVLDCLSRHLPFFDRKIEVIILSHPQKDHFGGLIDVIKRYEVDAVVATSLNSGSQDYQVLINQVGSRGIKVINPVEGQKLRVGLMYLDVLWPPKETFLGSENSMLASASGIPSGQASQVVNGVLGVFTSKKDPNDFSVVAILSFKNFDALLTGDIGPTVTDDLIGTGMVRDIEFLKVPHHGSKNGLTQSLLDASIPEVAVISVGAKNSYGHPHEEVIKLLSDKGIMILRTDLMGDVVVETDGGKIWQNNKIF